MQAWQGKRVIFKNKVFRIQSILKLSNRYSVLGFWEVNGSIPKNSHVDHFEIQSLDEIKLIE